MDKAKIRKYLEVIRRASDLIEKELQGGMEITPDELKAPITSIEAKPEKIIDGRPQQMDKLLFIKEWPEAIVGYNSDYVLTTEDKIDSANALIQILIDTPLNGINFLDFGCGESLVASQVLELGAKTSTAYDICDFDFAVNSSFNFTTEFDSLKKAYYDVILLNDVLDHCMNPEVVMQQVKSLLDPKGIVYVRCHPWTAKHGAHLHKTGLNKSYIHLFLTEKELALRNYKPIFVRHETNPLEAYKWWFKDFNIDMERVIKDELNPFFKNPVYQNLIFEQQNVAEQDKKKFIENMKIIFVDYVLTIKES